MASSSSRGDEDDGQKRNITSLDSVGASECAVATLNTVNTDPDREMQAPEQYSTPPSSSSWYHSARIQDMLEKRDKFTSDSEFEIESSRVHHSEVDIPACDAELSKTTNREYFELLRHRQYALESGDIVVNRCTGDDESSSSAKSMFMDWDGLVVGEKMAEGGQAEIYQATDFIFDGIGNWIARDWVVKVFKAGTLLQELEKQWPPALLNLHQRDDRKRTYSPRMSLSATLLKDESLVDRFAFVMPRRWGDLRKLIDQQMMQHSNNQGPPFTPVQVLELMWSIAFGMKGLHGQHPPILHKDLKAANVLVHGGFHVHPRHEGPFLDQRGRYWVDVADYECSVGVVGTGFWRAPEILQQLKDKVPSSKLVFTEKCDVYSYGLTCYEIVTGCLPFEGYPSYKYDIVLNGDRPELPPDLEPWIGEIITSCWHPIPSHRPSFEEVIEKLLYRFQREMTREYFKNLLSHFGFK